jgi:integrase
LEQLERQGESEQMMLFDSGGIDMARVRALRERLHATDLGAPLTVRGYSADWRLFARWCDRTGRRSLPATEETVGLYIAWLVEDRGRKTSTAARHIAAIRHQHRTAGMEPPETKDANKTIHAARRERKERPQGKRALSVADLVRVAATCEATTNRGARNRALLVVGFATSLRRSELVSLRLADISFEREGVAVLVRHSKTDQLGRGRLIGVWRGSRPETDPVGVLHAWIERRGRWDGPLFPRIDPRDAVEHVAIAGETVNEIVKRSVERIGLDPKPYGAHSLRAGAVTAAADLGRSDQEIMSLSGHENAAVMRQYVRRARVFDGRNPLAGVL